MVCRRGTGEWTKDREEQSGGVNRACQGKPAQCDGEVY